jgi:hypothetical protein
VYPRSENRKFSRRKYVYSISRLRKIQSDTEIANSTPSLANSYLRISNICHQRGDLSKAIKAAALALDAYTACLGPESSSATVTSQWYDKLQLEKMGIAMQDERDRRALEEKVQTLTVPGVLS